MTVSVAAAIEGLNPGLTLAAIGVLFASTPSDGLEHLARKLGMPFEFARGGLNPDRAGRDLIVSSDIRAVE